MARGEHGGTRSGSGRKPIPAGQRMRNRYQVAFTDAEAEELERIADAQEPRVSPAAYIRELVLRHLRRKR